jgi:Flp pilus assembly protein TadD
MISNYCARRCNRLATIFLILVLAATLSACGEPTDAELLAQVDTALTDGDEAEARIHLMNLLERDEANLEARLRLAELDLEAGNSSVAELGFTRAAKLRPADPRVRAGLAQAMAQQERAEGALPLLDPEPELPAADRARLLGLKGTLLTKLGRLDEARAALTLALDATPQDPDRLAEMALLEIAAGRGPDAERRIAESLALAPEHVATLLARASRLSSQRLYAAAEATFGQAEKAARAERRGQLRLAALLGLAEVQLLRQRTDAAAQTLAALDAQAPAVPAVRFVRASVAYQSGDARKAIDELLKILQESPDSLPARRLLGLSYAQEGLWNMADNHLAAVAAQSPADDIVQQALVEVRRRQAAPLEEGVAGRKVTMAPAVRRQALLDAAVQQLAYGQTQAALEFFTQAESEFPQDAQAPLGAAAALISRGRYDQAIAKLKEVTGESTVLPRNAMLLSAYISKGQPAEAVGVGGSLIQQFPGKAWPHDLHAIALQAAGRAPDARAALRRALDIDASDAFARTTLITLDLAAGDVAAADVLLQKIPTDTVSGRQLHAMAAMQRGDPARAQVLAEALVTAQPANADGHNLLGLARLAQGAAPAAVSHFETALLLAPKMPGPAVNLATAYLAIGEPEAAAVALQQARAAGAPSEALVDLDVRLAIARRDFALAGKLLEQVTPKDPDSVPRLTLLALLREAQGDRSGAAQALATAFNRAPSESLAIEAARMMQLAGRKDSTAPLDAWTRRAGPDADITVVRGDLALIAGDVAAARAAFEETLRLAPGHPAALNNLAWLYNEARDPRALEVAERALRAAPGDPRVMDTVGWVRLGAGRTAAAVELLEQAAKLAPGQPDIAYHLAMARIRNGEPERARPLLVEALRTADFPSRGAAATALQQLETGG